MIERLKALGDSAKGILIFIVAPIVFAAGYIYYLLVKDEHLQQKVDSLEAQDHIKDTMSKLQEAKHESDDAEADYRDAVAAYTAEHDGKGGNNVQ